jgi:hypothetical protein
MTQAGQSLTREGNLVRVRLTHTHGRPVPRTEYGPLTTYRLPEPVEIKAGESVAFDMDWLPEPARSEAGQPMYLRADATITEVITQENSLGDGLMAAACRAATGGGDD